MRLTLASLATASCLLMTACVSSHIAGVQPIDGVISGQCHTDSVRGAVGLAATAATIERARIDSDSEQVQVNAGTPNADFDSDGRLVPAASSGGSRLLIQTGRNNAITTLACG